MILPIFVFSQKIDSLIVKEIVSVGGDTLVIMPKSHAKKLSIERVTFQFLQESIIIKDSIISTKDTIIDNYKLTTDKFTSALLISNDIIANKDKIIESFRSETEKLNKQIRRKRSAKKWYFIGGVIIGGATISTIK